MFSTDIIRKIKYYVYLLSDPNTGDSSIEYFRYRIENEEYVSGQIYNLNAEYKLSVNSPDLGLYGAEIISGTVNITDMTVPSLTFSNLDLNYESTGLQYLNLQRFLASLNEKGVILSICSKNNDVQTVIQLKQKYVHHIN